MLITPLNSDLGVLFLQSYTTDSISDIFTDFIKSFFSKQGIYNKARVEKFVPKQIAEEFKNNCQVKRFTFSNRFILSEMTNEPINYDLEEFVIKVEVVSKNGLPKKSLPNWIKTIGDIFVSKKQLSEFNKGKVHLKNKNKESSFEINSKNIDIKPIIYLENRIDIGDDGLPNFKQLSKYCLDLLQNEIIPEMYCTNEVQEH